MTKEKEIITFYPASRQEWRDWLAQHHDKEQSIWIVQYKKQCNVPTLSWSDAVDEALCFGWIDSTRKTIDHERFMQFFTRRKPKSIWSKINKEKIQRLTEEGLMVKAGIESVETAKKNGSWSILDDVEELTIPKDLVKEFKLHKGSKTYFMSLSKSVKKMMLYWIVAAKRPETRQKRIAEIAESAGRGVRPKHF